MINKEDRKKNPHRKFVILSNNIFMITTEILVCSLANSYYQYRPYDWVQEKNENCVLFWRRIVRNKKSIVRVIVRDCAILSRRKYFVSHSL